MDSELKFFDTAIALTPVTTTGTVIASLNLVAQGTEEDQRIGRSIDVGELAFRYSLSLPLTAASATLPDGDTVRRIVFLDRQTNGAAAAVLDILQTADIHSFLNLSNQGRFTILIDEVMDMVALSTAITPGGNFNSPSVHKEIVWATDIDAVVEFNSTTGVIAEIRSNNLGVLFISHDGVAEMDGITRIRYFDFWIK